jgi:transcriptional regulator with XRE-family HTH domain
MNQVNTMIKLLRTEKGMNQEQLAEQLHVTRQAVSGWETGKTQPDIETLTRIAELFGVSVEQLIYGKTYDKASGVIKKTWIWNRNRLSLTFYPERLLLFGMMLATVVSYVNWHSILWAILHGLLNWGYILYYIIRY